MFNFSEKVDYDDLDYKEQVIEGIKQINRGMSEIYFHLKEIDNTLLATLTDGKGSILQRKRAYLIRIYSDYLIDEGLAKDEAVKRATFEVCNFDNDTLASDIERKILRKEKEKAEKDFFSCASFEKDIAEFWTVEKRGVRMISEYDLFAPIYELFNGTYSFDETKPIIVNWQADKDYYSFIKTRAIIKNLEKLGVLIKLTDSKRDIGNQNYRLQVTDLEQIKKIIYQGEAHDNDFFEERLKENKLPKLFETDIFHS